MGEAMTGLLAPGFSSNKGERAGRHSRRSLMIMHSLALKKPEKGEQKGGEKKKKEEKKP
jgi:hypothetical protein